MKAISATHSELKVVIEDKLLEELEELKNLLAQSHPRASVKDLLQYSVKVALNVARSKTVKTKRKERTLSAQQVKNVGKKVGPTKRYIPAQLRQRVWERDSACCTFQNKETGRRCTSKYGLELDHIKPFAMGGESSLENLRLRCRVHNQFSAIKSYGQNKMATYIPRLPKAI